MDARSCNGLAWRIDVTEIRCINSVEVDATKLACRVNVTEIQCINSVEVDATKLEWRCRYRGDADNNLASYRTRERQLIGKKLIEIEFYALYLSGLRRCVISTDSKECCEQWPWNFKIQIRTREALMRVT